MSIDTTTYYRLSNAYFKNASLDVKTNGTGGLDMTAPGSFSGQYWKMVQLGGDKYALRTEYLGDNFSLDVKTDGSNVAYMAPSGNRAGQQWTVTSWGNGTMRLCNAFSGPEMSLNTYDDKKVAMSAGHYTGQEWMLTPLKAIAENTAIPKLDGGDGVFESEADTEFFEPEADTEEANTEEADIKKQNKAKLNIFKKPFGKIKAVMLFVDFPDAPGAGLKTDSVADTLLGGGNAQKLLAEQSYSKMSLEVSFIPGWGHMKNNSGTYKPNTSYDNHKAYITEVASLYPDVSFSEYDFVYVASARGNQLGVSSAFHTTEGQGVQTGSGEIRWCITFGQYSLDNPYTELLHETGHLFGLPDLYTYGGNGATDTKAGCWAIMSDMFQSRSYLGWHRHKNEWLNADRKTWIATSGTQYLTISPLSADYGVSLVVLPIDSVEEPSKVLVIQVAGEVEKTGKDWNGKGVLLYTVDAKIATGKSPVEVFSKKKGHSKEYGNLYEAPYQVKDVANYTEESVKITVTVEQKIDDSYNLKIEYSR